MDGSLEEAIIQFLKQGTIEGIPEHVFHPFVAQGRLFQGPSKREAKKSFKTKAKTFMLSKSECSCLLAVFFNLDCLLCRSLSTACA